MPAEMFRVIARFERSDGQPLTGVTYSVSLLDEDRFFDDKLGEATLSSDGTAEFLIFTADILSFDSKGERTPDLYFVVRKNGKPIHRTEVFTDVSFDEASAVTGRADGLTKKFGPFRVPGV
jgi:hypothetical protein